MGERGTYIMCTLFETTVCNVCLFSFVDAIRSKCGVVIPRYGSGVRISKGFLPGLFHALRTLCKVLKHLGVLPIEKIVVIVELLNLFQFFFTGSLSVVKYLIGLPFCRVFVTVGNQAAVVPLLVHELHAEKELPCQFTVLLIFQLQLRLSKFHSSTKFDGRFTTYLVIKNTV